MSPTTALTGATGKIGGAVLDAILTHDLLPPSDIVIATSSSADNPRLKHALSRGVTIRKSNYDSVQSMVEAFQGCERLFLVSTPHIDLDFNDCAKGGREMHHFNALTAAKQAGISHVYYTSLAFQNPSKAAVMRAHLKTEEYLKSQQDFNFTILREGIYSESWPLYLGHFEVPNDLRESVVIGPDGPISWTSISDLGVANALIITGDKRVWSDRTLWLSSSRSLSIAETASIVGKARKRPLAVEIKSQQAYIKHYTEDVQMDGALIEWWSTTYPALAENECNIQDSPFEELLAQRNMKPTTMEEVVENMFGRNG